MTTLDDVGYTVKVYVDRDSCLTVITPYLLYHLKSLLDVYKTDCSTNKG